MYPIQRTGIASCLLDDIGTASKEKDRAIRALTEIRNPSTDDLIKLLERHIALSRRARSKASFHDSR